MFVESLVPYNKTVLWDIHDRHHHNSTELPQSSNRERVIAIQHANFLCTLYEQECKGGLFLEGDSFYVLTIGSGGTHFARRIIQSLKDCGKTGLVLSRALHIIVAEPQPSSHTTEMGTPSTEDFGQQLIPGYIDPKTKTLRDREGQPLTEEPQVLFVNFLFSSSRGAHILSPNGEWNSLYAQVQLSSDEWNHLNKLHNSPSLSDVPLSLKWKSTALETILPEEQDQALMKQLSAIHHGGAVYYPQKCIELLRKAVSFMSNRGTIVISDYGSPPTESRHGTTQPSIVFQNQSIYNPIHFSLFSIIAQQEGWSALLTHSPIRNTHHACMKINSPMSRDIQASFQHQYNTNFDAEDLQIFWETAIELMEQKQYERASYFAGRCTEINARDPRYPYLAARALIAANKPQAAQYYLEVGSSLPYDEACNFSFQLGRLAMMRGFPHEAIRYYLQSKEHSEFPALYCNLAHAYLDVEQVDQAYACIQISLQIDPTHIPSQECRLRIKEEVWTTWQKNKS